MNSQSQQTSETESRKADKAGSTTWSDPMHVDRMKQTDTTHRPRPSSSSRTIMKALPQQPTSLENGEIEEIATHAHWGRMNIERMLLLKATQSQHFRFLDLPKDIRIMVYDHLIVDNFITICRKRGSITRDDYESFRLCGGKMRRGEDVVHYGNKQLLMVCREIRAETLLIWLSRNVFVWPSNGRHALADEFCRLPGRGLAMGMLRSLRLSFTLDDVDWNDLSDRMHADWGMPGHGDECCCPAARQCCGWRVAVVHHQRLRAVWTRNLRALFCLRLDYLELDMHDVLRDRKLGMEKQRQCGGLLLETFQDRRWVELPKVISIEGMLPELGDVSERILDVLEVRAPESTTYRWPNPQEVESVMQWQEDVEEEYFP